MARGGDLQSRRRDVHQRKRIVKASSSRQGREWMRVEHLQFVLRWYKSSRTSSMFSPGFAVHSQAAGSDRRTSDCPPGWSRAGGAPIPHAAQTNSSLDQPQLGSICSLLRTHTPTVRYTILSESLRWKTPEYHTRADVCGRSAFGLSICSAFPFSQAHMLNDCARR